MGIERVRVGKFVWERLMVLSPLPWATRGVLLVVGIYMDEDGGSARPGMDNLMAATRLGKTVLVAHLRSAVMTGYLDQVERGGHRGGRTRASVYAATVPKEVFILVPELLASSPWRRKDDEQDQRSADRTLTPQDQGSADRTFTTDDQDQGSLSQDQGSLSARSRFGQPNPIKQLHQSSTSSKQPAAAAIAIVTSKTDATPDEAAAVVELIRTERQPRTLTAMVRKIADDGDLPDNWLARVRKANADQAATDHRDAIRSFRAQLASEPTCEHGYAGGHLDGPGGPVCPIWRKPRTAA